MYEYSYILHTHRLKDIMALRLTMLPTKIINYKNFSIRHEKLPFKWLIKVV